MNKKKNKKTEVNKIKTETKGKLTNLTTQKPKEDKQKQEEISENFNDHIQSIATSKISRFLLLALTVLILVFSFYSYIQHKTYQKSLSQTLPLDSTYSFYEVNYTSFLDQTQRYQNHPNKEQISELINQENLLLNQTQLTPILKNPIQKNISIQVYESQKFSLFIYELKPDQIKKIKFPIQVIKQNSDQEWFYALKDNLLSISNSKEVSLLPFQKEIPKITSSYSFQDAYLNTPKHNLAWFAINHSFNNQLANDSLFSNNSQTFLNPVSQFLGFTIGYLNVNTQGLLVGTYTNPNPDSQINLSPLRNLDKFNPTLQKFLPPLQSIDLLVSGTEVFTMIEHMIKSNPNNQIQLQNLATQRNLTPENLATIKQIFTKEYLVYKQSDSFTLLLQKLNKSQQEQVTDILINLEAFYNPTINSYVLEDGSIARTNSPSNPIQRDLTNQDELSFRLADLGQTINFDLSNSKYEKITYAPIQSAILPRTQGLESEQDKPKKFFNLLPEGSSHLYISEDQMLDLLQSQDLDFYPSQVNSSTFFFDDGIQIVFQLSW